MKLDVRLGPRFRRKEGEGKRGGRKDKRCRRKEAKCDRKETEKINRFVYFFVDFCIERILPIGFSFPIIDFMDIILIKCPVPVS
jgi:hypothetical protein